LSPQCRRLLRWLEVHRTIDPMTSWNDLGIYRLASRISELRKLGYPITRAMVKRRNRWGEVTRVAEYRLGER